MPRSDRNETESGVGSAALYHRDRAAAERDAADRSSCMVKDVHLELAALHEVQADGAVPEEGSHA